MHKRIMQMYANDTMYKDVKYDHNNIKGREWRYI
jgi:hypothetical protein